MMHKYVKLPSHNVLVLLADYDLITILSENSRKDFAEIIISLYALPFLFQTQFLDSLEHKLCRYLPLCRHRRNSETGKGYKIPSQIRRCYHK